MTHLMEEFFELAMRMMRWSSRAGHNELDHFGGSGRMLIAAMETSRRCFMMELDPLYAHGASFEQAGGYRWRHDTGCPRDSRISCGHAE